MNDKYTESDIHIKSRLLEKLDNFWFYYKIPVIVALAVVFILSVCIAQSCAKEDEDVTVMYAGPYLYSATELERLRGELNSAMPADFDGNGEKYTALVTYQVMTEEQILEYEKWLNSDDSSNRVDRTYFTTQFQTYNNYMLTGECAVLLLDPSLYGKLVEAGRLKKLSEVFAEIPASAIDDYGIKLSETPLYKNSTELAKLPEDTVLCLSLPYVFGSSGNEREYSRMTSMFVAMAKD